MSDDELSAEHKKLLMELLNRPGGKESFIKELKKDYEKRLRLELLFDKSN